MATQEERDCRFVQYNEQNTVMATLRFIQLRMPLLPLKPMDQSRRGAPHILEA